MNMINKMLSVLFMVTILITSSAAKTQSKEKQDNESSMSKYADNNSNVMDIDVMAIMRECNSTYKMDMSYLESLNESGSFPDETNKNAKCYIRCLLEKSGIITSDEEFNTTLTAMIYAGERNGLQMTDLEQMANSCIERNETCKCERSYQYIRCFMEKQIEKYEEDMDSTK